MSEPPWVSEVRELAARAPDWMRERASAELDVEVIQARLDTPELDVAALSDEAGARALTFFLVVCLASGAPIARVRCERAQAAALSRRAKRALGRAVERIDDANAALMGYLDVYLRERSTIDAAAAAGLVRRLRQAVAAPVDRAADR